jgi:dynein heavy chain
MQEVENKPQDGCYVYGLFLEGARFVASEQVLGESEAKVLFTACPMIWLKPCRRHEVE